jgi:Flp pilus assembly secretin CpaC
VPAPAANLVLHLGHDEVAWLPDNVATIVIGNTLIADVSIQPDGLMVFTGKSSGTTNIVMFDRSGSVVMSRVIEVRGPRDNNIVTVPLETGGQVTYFRGFAGQRQIEQMANSDQSPADRR